MVLNLRDLATPFHSSRIGMSMTDIEFDVIRRQRTQASNVDSVVV